MILTIKNLIRALINPEQHSIKNAQGRVDTAISELERTIHMSKADLFAAARIEVANDVQHTVVFSTFAEICRYRTKNGAYNLCRNGAHEASASHIAQCNEEQCPLMRTRVMTK